MAGDHSDVVREGQETVVDRLQDLLSVAAGQVGSAYGAAKEGVSGDENGLIRDVEAAAALGVTWSVDDGAGESDDGDGLAVF